MKYGTAAMILASALMAAPAWAAPTANAITKANPHSCEAFYPVSAVAGREAGTMVVGFTISAQGDVLDPKVSKGSGYSDLDQAGLDCVKSWRYAPATHAGKPVAAPWKAELVWVAPPGAAVPRPNSEPLEFASVPRHCFDYYHITPHQVAHIDGTTTVSYRVTNGTVSDVTVAHSSGNADLDQKAVSCVSSWQYKSVTRSGKSSDRTTSMSIPWRDALSTPERPHNDD